MRVFISSVIRGLEQLRGAARNGVVQAGMQPVMAEDPELFPAQSLSPQMVCFQGIEDSDVFVLILGQRYGDLTESGLSAVEEEYWHARLNEKEIKIFVQSMDREPEQEEFLTRISRWESYRAWYRNDRLHQALWYKSPRDYAKITCNSKLLVA